MGKIVESTLTVSDFSFDYGSAGSTEVTYEGATGIIATVVDHPEAVVNITNSTVTVLGLDAGTYTLEVTTISDENHDSVTQTAEITVNQLKTELSATAVTTTYNINKNMVITLKDAGGNPISKADVTVSINGAKVYTTDDAGQITVQTGGLAANTYTAAITFAGNTNYEKSTANVKVTVKKATPKMTAKKTTFKTKSKKYTVTLKDNTGNAIKKAKLTLKVNGKTYKATTNAKGKATFKLTKLTKKGSHKATVTYNGNANFNKLSKKVTLKVKK